MPISVEINVEVPELVLNSSFIRNQIYRALQTQIRPKIHKLFDQTIEGWSDKPAFHESGHNWLSEVAVRVWTDNARYAYVNNGTPPHTITPRGRGMLRFRPGYTAGTRPRVLSSKKPGRFGDYVSAWRVKHPGIEARNFDVEIAEQIFPEFVDAVNEAIHLGINFAK
ncbi:MAG: hypothetical protein M0Z43_08860 [Acidithiobacillus sp.]|nr:hypothetical protein [Acidithiobacillus sp.]